MPALDNVLPRHSKPPPLNPMVHAVRDIHVVESINLDGHWALELATRCTMPSPCRQELAVSGKTSGSGRIFRIPRRRPTCQPGTRDANGQFMAGTETLRLLAHGGKLFASMGYWMDKPYGQPKGDDPWTGAQILRSSERSARHRGCQAVRVTNYVRGLHSRAYRAIFPINVARVPDAIPRVGQRKVDASKATVLGFGHWHGQSQGQLLWPLAWPACVMPASSTTTRPSASG